MTEKILIISGPTASGKSALAMELAQKMDIAIINADALQIYAGLPILSSQPSHKDQKEIKHFLYSHLQPKEQSSVGNWLELVKSTVEEVWREKKLPVIVGGTGMYISKLFEGISEIPAIDDSIRIKARQLFEEVGKEIFLKELLALDDEFFAREEYLKNLDKQRLIRIYEVSKQTGKSIFYWQNLPPKKLFAKENFMHLGLNLPRQKLYENCNLRFEKMLEIGAVKEVKELLRQGIGEDFLITKTLGFLEIKSFLAGQISRQKMIELASQKTRNYAKRQLTYFRHQLPERLVFTEAEAALTFLQNEIYTER